MLTSIWLPCYTYVEYNVALTFMYTFTESLPSVSINACDVGARRLRRGVFSRAGAPAPRPARLQATPPILLRGQRQHGPD